MLRPLLLDNALHKGDTAATEVIRALLVDDHPVLREGLRHSLERLGGIRVVGEAGDGAAALQLACELQLDGESQIDIAVVDVSMPGMDGYETAAELRRLCPSIRIALMSGFFDSRRAERGRAAGADGLLLKTESPEQLGEFIREICSGVFCCSEAVRQIMLSGENLHVPGLSEQTNLGVLSAREREVFEALARGASLKQAAHRIGISYKSADHLKQKVMKKLQVHDRVELVRLAIREGLTC